ncbi:MAG: GNAT family N-acetyltransferase, partial [Pseudoxanthomonas sp.]
AAEIASLAAEALEPNPFYEPWQLLPALELLAPTPPLLVTVRDHQGRLCGFFPAHLEKKFHGFPIRVLKLWRHEYCFLGTPLLAARDAQYTLVSLMDKLGSQRAPARIIEWSGVALDGEFWSLLAPVLQGNPAIGVDIVRHERALLITVEQGHANASGKHTKELRRLHRRLANLGEVRFRAWQPVEDMSPWLHDFLQLEESGWKGQTGTALASQTASREYFSRVLMEGARLDRVQMLALELNGEPIAMKCNFLAGKGGFAFKIAYKESHAQYSPGVLLEQFNVEHVASPVHRIEWMDSCAKPGHEMIERLWSGRRAIAARLIIGNGAVAGNLVRSMPFLRAARRFTTKFLKDHQQAGNLVQK